MKNNIESMKRTTNKRNRRLSKDTKKQHKQLRKLRQSGRGGSRFDNNISEDLQACQCC